MEHLINAIQVGLFFSIIVLWVGSFIAVAYELWSAYDLDLPFLIRIPIYCLMIFLWVSVGYALWPAFAHLTGSD